jgi:hypothetical protein
MDRTSTLGAKRSFLSLAAALLALALAISLLATGTAWAARGGVSAAECPGQPLSQVFLPWGDEGWYTPIPDGGFERGAQGWALEGGARVVDGNEPFQVGGSDDARSLLLPAGSAAVSPPICVSRSHETLRGFARYKGARVSHLVVQMVWQERPGRTRSLPIGNLRGRAAWKPTRIMKLVVSALGLRPGETAEVSFRFAPRGKSGKWWIDDFYVDPFRRS